MKKILIVLMVLAFACSSLLLMTSCAKKQVKGEEAAPAAAPEKAPESKVKPSDDEAYKKAEAERQARLRQLEREAALKNEMEKFMSENVYFDFDKSDLKAEAQAILKKKADWLNKNKDFFVRIEGHCDERGTNEYNLALGERRAYSAKKFLVDMGISDNKIRTISYGEERPADPGHNEEAWAKNRRDEFKLLK
ncbi:MAG: peptidoglycan-associated lipoprotein Pal [Pseudomonadota bacterium]